MAKIMGLWRDVGLDTAQGWEERVKEWHGEYIAALALDGKV